MAMVAVQGVLSKLATLLAEEAQLLGGVRSKVEEIRDDLESMRSFLQDVETRSEIDQGVKTWVKQVRDLAYDADDVLEEYLLLVLSPPRPREHHHRFFLTLCIGFHFLPQLRRRHRLAGEIENVKGKIKAISERQNAFALTRIEEPPSSSSRIAAATLRARHDPRLASLFIDEADTVGIENPKSLLISWLVKGEENLTAISVVGMGGVGKTTLVKMAYDSPAVKKHFNCHAWITVSKSFTVAELLQSALKDLLEERKELIPENMRWAFAGGKSRAAYAVVHNLSSFI